MTYDVIIVGGGASGLCTAICAKKKNNRILIIEHGLQLGKKILSTGNGKCNLTNKSCTFDKLDKNPEGIYPYFSSSDKGFAGRVIKAFDRTDTERFFNSLGILLKDKNGYVYPMTEQAKTVSAVLSGQIQDLGIDVIYQHEIKSIEKDRDLFVIDGRYKSRQLVLSCGGMSASKTGSDGSGYALAAALGHTVINPRPALCGVKCQEAFLKKISGVRWDGKINLYSRGRVLSEISGNIQFTDYGVSGIPVFQLSAQIGECLENNNDCRLEIDLLPELSLDELESFIKNRRGNYLTGILNDKLAAACTRLSNENKEPDFIHSLCIIVKHFRLTPVSLMPFENAQTTAGGVSAAEINPDTMESKLIPRLYFTGEIIDVNGICGGYNLQWAWSTAHICAAAITGEKQV